MNAMEIRLLGPPLVRWGKEMLSLGPKASALVAVLAVEGSATRERVLGQLWPESTQQKAQGSLRHLLHSLKKAVAGIVEADNTTLRLSPNAKLDIHQLSVASTPAQRSAAAELCRGTFCEGLQGGSPELDDWLEQQRVFWSHTVTDNFLHLARLLPPGEGLKPARQAVLLDPLNESAQATLIELLLRSGEIAEAHRQFERCRELLFEELGVEPSPSLRDLFDQDFQGRTRHNLPFSSVLLRGRESHLDVLRSALEKSRLVSITGEGGVGKTALALEAARALSEQCNVWLVELADYADPNGKDALEKVIAKSCGVPEGCSWTEFFADQNCLLVLDNCEHVIRHVAQTVQPLLASCPGLNLLVTSREPLRLGGEWVVPLDPLELPPVDHPDPQKFAAVALFLERAEQSGAQISESDLSAVAEICRRLDGLPLALELAAARVRALSPAGLLKGLDQRFRLLKSNKTDSEARQRTLGALIDWSYSRLEESDQTTFCRLSVFRSGFFAESAGEILGADAWDTADSLERLVERSLLRTKPLGGGLRYYFLESLREFGWNCVQTGGKAQELQRAHLSHFLLMAESLCPLTKGEKQRVWLDKLDSELSNFRAALEYAWDNEKEMGLQLAAALCPLWKDRDHRQEGREWLARFLQEADRDNPQWARALLLRGELETQQGLAEEALLTLHESLSLGRTSGALEPTARACKGLGSALCFLKRFEEARDHFKQARALYEETGDHHEVANCVNNLGMVALCMNELESAQQLFEESLASHRDDKNDMGQGVAIGNLGFVALKRRDFESARQLLADALIRLQEVGAQWNAAYFLEGMAQAQCGLGHPRFAVECLAVADELRRKLRTPRLFWEVEGYEESVQSLRRKVADFDQIKQSVKDLGLEEFWNRLRAE